MKPEHARALLRIARATASLELPVVLDGAVRMTRETLGVGTVIVYVLSEDGRFIDRLASAGGRSRARRWPVESAGPNTAEVLRTGREVRAPGRAGSFVQDARYRSFAIVPIKVARARIGCLVIAEARKERHYDRHEMEFLRGVAAQVGLSIRNARLATDNRRRLDALRRVSRRLWAVQEAERRRLSRELHDEAGQALTAITLQVRVLGRSTRSAALQGGLAEIGALSRQVLEDLRRVARDLRPSALDELGLVAAIEAHARSVAARADFEVRTSLERRVRLPEEAAITAFRFVQEALTNAARHAGARRVGVSARQLPDGSVRFRVTDDGRGLPNKVGRGLGLAGMAERASLSGGALRIESVAGRGARLTLSFPSSVVRRRSRSAPKSAVRRHPGERRRPA